jgi:hypothetical protein
MLKKHQFLMKIGGGCVAAAISLTGVQSAQALNFNFEFTDGTTTVTGIVDGLSVGTTSASSVEIFTTEADLPGSGTYNNGQIATAWNNTGITPENSFTVDATGTTITAFNFLARQNTTPVNGQRDIFCLNSTNSCNSTSAAALTLNNGTDIVLANASGVTFTSTSAAVPFEFHPSLGLLMVLGFWGTKTLSQKIKTRKELDNLSLDTTSV